MALSMLLPLSARADDNSRAKHVIWLGLDGWAGYCFDDTAKVEMPNIRALMAQGAWTANARSVLPTISGANWPAMFSGVSPALHGYQGNELKPKVEPIYRNEHGTYPTIFHVLRQARPDAEIGVIAEWGQIPMYVDTICCSHVECVKGWDKDPMGMKSVNILINYIKEKKPELVFFHNDQIDHAGHSYGHRTEKYFHWVEIVDKQIPLIIQATKDAGIYDDCVFILQADHGGKNYGHGGLSRDEYRVPIVIFGKGIKKGFEITDVTQNMDITATIAHILGLKEPKCWRSKLIDTAFEE